MPTIEEILGGKRAKEFWQQYAATQDAKVSDTRARAGHLRLPDFDVSRLGAPDAIYEPTATSNPNDPRTASMSYWREERKMLVRWGDGGVPYVYDDVDPSEWRRMLRVKSPGRMINRVFNSKPYGPVGNA
jgi:hypothetical protein